MSNETIKCPACGKNLYLGKLKYTGNRCDQCGTTVNVIKDK